MTAEELNLKDGEYTAEVTMEGGSGRATIDSPTDISVKDGKVTAEIKWSSSHYDYMLVDGEQMSRPDIVLVGLFAIGIVGSLIDWLFLALTNKILPWNTETGDKYAA